MSREPERPGFPLVVGDVGQPDQEPEVKLTVPEFLRGKEATPGPWDILASHPWLLVYEGRPIVVCGPGNPVGLQPEIDARLIALLGTARNEIADVVEAARHRRDNPVPNDAGIDAQTRLILALAALEARVRSHPSVRDEA